MRVFREFVLAVKFHNRLSHTLMTGVDYIILSMCLIGQTFAVFAAPIGINRLLRSVIIICGSCLQFIIFSVTWNPAVQIPLFGHGSGLSGSLLGQLSGMYAINGISLLYRGR